MTNRMQFHPFIFLKDVVNIGNENKSLNNLIVKFNNNLMFCLNYYKLVFLLGEAFKVNSNNI